MSNGLTVFWTRQANQVQSLLKASSIKMLCATSFRERSATWTKISTKKQQDYLPNLITALTWDFGRCFLAWPVNHDAKGISRWVVSMDRDDPWKDISGFTPTAAGETKYKCFDVDVDFYTSILRKATKSIV